MIQFLIYLFETGFCLSLLYLVYHFFLRKETFFYFNRVYLISIIGLSLLIPLLHINIGIINTRSIEDPIQEISRFRGYYTEFISWSDSDIPFRAYRKYQRAVFEHNDLYTYPTNTGYATQQNSDITSLVQPEKQQIQTNIGLTPARLFLLVYLVGVIFFLGRLLFLILWIRKTVHAYSKTNNNDYSLVHVNKAIPPFSFFRYIFMPENATALHEFEQILAHEKVHVKQKHSMDLMIAHVISVFQWFNPFVWQLQKSIKITHEYIADSNVVRQGFKLVDYQSLLLSQLISIRSVELVNNFNLLSIKKRITMMTKNKSGRLAKLKVLFVIPVALAVFLVFSDMTFQSPVFSFTNFTTGKTSKLDGIWKNTNQEDYGSLLLFKGNQLSILESKRSVNVVDIPITVTSDAILVNGQDSKNGMRYELQNGTLTLWWNDTERSVYSRTDSPNSLAALLPAPYRKVNLPMMSQSKLLDKPSFLYSIYVTPEAYYVDDIKCSLEDLKETIKNRVSKFRVIDRPFITAHLFADKETKMQHLYPLLQILRELELYKIGYANIPKENMSVLHYHVTALPMLLPPKDAKILEEKEVEDKLFKFAADDNVKTIDSKLSTFIRSHPEYIIKFGWHNHSTYGEYLDGIDMVFTNIYALRDKYSLDKYSISYNELPEMIQKEVRKVYPVRLTHVNLDEE